VTSSSSRPARSAETTLPFCSQRLDLDRADELDGRRSDQDLARLRRLLQPRRDVDGIARREPLLRACHHLARIHAGAQREGGAVVALELLVQGGERGAHLAGGAHGAQSVVLVEHGHAEDRHHGVPDELLDRAAMTLDHGPHRLEVARHHSAPALGVEPFSKSRGAGHVAEDHGDGSS